jgi:hypothetical protein
MSGALPVHPLNDHVIDRVSLPYLLQLNSGLYYYICRHRMKPTYDIDGKIQQIKLIKSKIYDIFESETALFCNSVFKLINKAYFIRIVLI